MLHVERRYARRVRGSRNKASKVVGHRSVLVTYGMSGWNKELFGNTWFKEMAWNRAALRVEGGVPTDSARRAYYYRYPEKWVRELSK